MVVPRMGKDIARKIQANRDFTSAEQKRVKDTLKALQSKFEYKLKELRDDFEGKINAMRKYNREQFKLADTRLQNLEEEQKCYVSGRIGRAVLRAAEARPFPVGDNLCSVW